MWRFMLLSFAFLGWAFFEMSGGADYRPSANSIQARAVLDNQRPRARPLRVNVIELTQAPAQVPSGEPLRDMAGLARALGQAEVGAAPVAVTVDLPLVRVTVPASN